MAFSKGFEHDVFISYRRVDNNLGWVNRLEDVLLRLFHRRAVPGSDGQPWDYSIFRDDHGIDGNEPLPKAIREAAESSALLLVVMSHNYADGTSHWCAEERRLFLKASELAKRSDNVFVVRMTDIELPFWPGKFRNLKGYDFFERSPASGRTQEVSLDFSQSGRLPGACYELANDAWNRLNNDFPTYSRWVATPNEDGPQQCRVFSMCDDGSWIEATEVDGQCSQENPIYRFSEAKRVRDSVNLFDATRDYGIRLGLDQCDLRDGASSFKRYLEGRWASTAAATSESA